MSDLDPFRDRPDEPNGGGSGELVPSDAPMSDEMVASMNEALSRVEREVCHMQPVARDLNRHLTDLLGPCPVTDDGRWVQLFVTDESPEGAVIFPALPVHEALRLTTALRQIASEVDLAQVRNSLPQPRSYTPCDMARPVAFLVAPRDSVGTGSKFHRKGR